MKRKLLAILFLTSLTVDHRPASAAILDYSAIVCGIPTLLGLWTSRMYPPGAIATIGAAVACTSAYYGLLAVGQSGIFSSLSEEQAKAVVHNNQDISRAASFFGQAAVIKVLQLPQEQQTEENIVQTLIHASEERSQTPEA